MVPVPERNEVPVEPPSPPPFESEEASAADREAAAAEDDAAAAEVEDMDAMIESAKVVSNVVGLSDEHIPRDRKSNYLRRPVNMACRVTVPSSVLSARVIAH